jgi:hypothetical protein
VPAKAVPPVGVEYHFIPAPVTAKLATVGLSIAQNGCVEEPVGAAGSVMVAVTSNLVELSQPLIV